MDFAVEITQQATPGPATVVAVTGEVDLCTAPELRQAILDALAEEPHCIQVDLSEVSLLDSTGVFVLVDAYKRARERGVVLYIENPQQLVRRVLSICGLLDTLTEGEPQNS